MFAAEAIAEIPPTHLGSFSHWILAQQFTAGVQFFLASGSVQTPMAHHFQIWLGQVLEEPPHEVHGRQLHDATNLRTGDLLL